MTLTKAEFLANLQTGREQLWAFVESLSVAHFSAQRDAAGWSIQDHLLHMADWEKGITAVLQHQSYWEAMGLDYADIVAQRWTVDERNEVLRMRQTGKGVIDTLYFIKTVQAAFDEMVAATSEADLQQPFTFFHPDKPLKDTGAPLIERLAAHTYKHYAQHLDWMEKLTTPPTKAEFLENLTAGRKLLWDFINGLSVEQLNGQRDEGGWAIQDHLAHLAIWEKGITALLNQESRLAAMGVPLATWQAGGVNGINDVIFHQHKDKSAAEILVMLEEVQTRLDTTLTALSEQDFLKSYHAAQPEAIKDMAIVWYLIGNTFEHYARHLPWMQALV